MKEIIFKKNVNGYDLVIVNFEGEPHMRLLNGNNDIEILIDDSLDSHKHLRSKSYSLIGFKIQTTSFGSKSVTGIEKLIEKYQTAVDSVEIFEAALQELEASELEVTTAQAAG